MTAGRSTVAATLIALAAVFAASGVAHATTLDPFRRTGATTAPAFDPVKVADATPAPSAAAIPAPATPAPIKCERDEQCPENNFCQAGTCQRIQTRTNFLYLFYREGNFTEALLLYWSKRGAEGYTVLAPFYWHFWNPQSETTVIFPVLPVSWTRGPSPGQSSFAIWPLFYKSTKLGWAAPLLGTFALRDPDKGTAGGAVLFLYWWRRGPDRALDVGFPLFVSKRSSRSAFTWALPLNFYSRTDDDAHWFFFPLFYAHSWKSGGSFYTWLGYHRRVGRSSGNSIAWLYWFGGDEAADSRYDVLFPLIWSFRRPSSSTTVAGPFLHFRRGDASLSALFPVWWRWRDGKGDGFHVSPLYFWRRSDGGKSALLVTPLGGYARDDAAGTRTWLALPFFFHRRDRDRDLRIFTPLYVSSSSKHDQSLTRLSALLFYQHRDPEGSTTAVLPLFWHFRDAATDSTATILFPLFAHRSGPHDSSTMVTLFYWRSFKDGGWSGGLFPLAYFGSNAGRRHAVVFPLFWHFSSERSSTTLALPLFYRRSDSHGYDSVWLPLFFMGNRDGERYAVQFPTFFHYSSERAGTSTTVTPIGYVHTDRDGWSAGLGPLVPLLWVRSGQTRSHFALLPFIWHFKDKTADRTTTVVGPYWHRRWGGETTDALFPLLHYRRGAKPGGSDETSFTLFPFVHYRRDADTRIIATPLGVSARGPNRAAGFIGPYLWYDDKDLSARLVPFLYADVQRKDTGERTRQVLNWFQIDAPGRKARVLFPLFGHYEDDKESDTWAFPNFFRMRRTNGDRADSFLIYWHSSFGGKTTTVIGPYYNREAPGVHNTGVFPLYFFAKNPERTMTVVPPLAFFYRRNWQENKTWVWWGLFFHRSEPTAHLTTLFPIYWSKRNGPRTARILFPLYWRFADTEAQTDWTLAGPLYWSKEGSRHTYGLLPVAWVSRDHEKQTSSNALLPLFYQASGPDRTTFLTLAGGYHRNGPSRFWYIGPLWFNKSNEATETTTRVVPPLLLVSHTTPSSSFTTFAGIFWRHRDVVSATTLVLPLFYDVNEFHATRTTVLLPLFVRHENAAEQSTTWVAPLVYRRSSPTESTTVAFPLFWDFKKSDRRTTVLFPLFAHWRRPGYASTWVFPTYYQRKGLAPDGTPDGTYRRLFAPLFETAVKRRGDFMWEVLGGLVGTERVGHHHFLKLFWFFDIETSAAPRGQTAWYSQPPRSARKNVARGLSVAGF